ncbi:hypothetical protein L1049_016199 [Liquidambar formosana]|uniref:Uncharacterized protein n=1 Tax=Liquidambar formosana TaxID=63359 RepID=A0AAP0S086_LIQFO
MNDGIEGIAYDGASPRVLRVYSDIRVNELTEKIYGIMGSDWTQYELEIICRYLVGLAPRQFIPLPIVDDASVDAMFEMIRSPISKLTCIQLYLERKPTLPVHASPIGFSTPYTHTSTVEADVCTIQSSNEGGSKPIYANRTMGVHPSPDNSSVLTLQPEHRSEDVWDGKVIEPLHCRHHKVWPLHEHVQPLVHHAGF